MPSIFFVETTKRHFDLSFAMLRQASVLYGKISNLDVVMMQVRHMQYHVGHCNSILRERGLEAVAWMDYFGE